MFFHVLLCQFVLEFLNGGHVLVLSFLLVLAFGFEELFLLEVFLDVGVEVGPQVGPLFLDFLLFLVLFTHFGNSVVNFFLLFASLHLELCTLVGLDEFLVDDSGDHFFKIALEEEDHFGHALDLEKQVEHLQRYFLFLLDDEVAVDQQTVPLQILPFLQRVEFASDLFLPLVVAPFLVVFEQRVAHLVLVEVLVVGQLPEFVVFAFLSVFFEFVRIERVELEVLQLLLLRGLLDHGTSAHSPGPDEEDAWRGHIHASVGVVVKVAFDEGCFDFLTVSRESVALLVDLDFSVRVATEKEPLVFEGDGAEWALVAEFALEECRILVGSVGQDVVRFIHPALEQVDVGDDLVEQHFGGGVQVHSQELGQYLVRFLFVGSELLGFVQLFHQSRDASLDFFQIGFPLEFLVVDFLLGEVVQNENEVELQPLAGVHEGLEVTGRVDNVGQDEAGVLEHLRLELLTQPLVHALELGVVLLVLLLDLFQVHLLVLGLGVLLALFLHFMLLAVFVGTLVFLLLLLLVLLLALEALVLLTGDDLVRDPDVVEEEGDVVVPTEFVSGFEGVDLLPWDLVVGHAFLQLEGVLLLEDVLDQIHHVVVGDVEVFGEFFEQLLFVELGTDHKDFGVAGHFGLFRELLTRPSEEQVPVGLRAEQEDSACVLHCEIRLAFDHLPVLLELHRVHEVE